VAWEGGVGVTTGGGGCIINRTYVHGRVIQPHSTWQLALVWLTVMS
jgi:hypothetical protein